MYAVHMFTEKHGSGKNTSGLIPAAALWKRCLLNWNGCQRIKSECPMMTKMMNMTKNLPSKYHVADYMDEHMS